MSFGFNVYLPKSSVTTTNVMYIPKVLHKLSAEKEIRQFNYFDNFILIQKQNRPSN